jgi:tetratricopeptide (TPR) repeat protein
VGVFRRLFGQDQNRNPSDSRSAPRTWSDSVAHFDQYLLYSGQHDLEIVGESNYQDNLWRVVGGRTTERVRLDVQAIIATEPDNPHDRRAISVWINGHKVGYFCREDAQAYHPGLVALSEKEDAHVALTGVVTGGGLREGGLGFLGVWLYCTPADFGVEVVVPPAPWTLRGNIRTGLTEALLTDEADDSYDLSWLRSLPSDNVAAARRLRALLKDDPDPIDRHFMYCELEERLYKSRDVFSSALDDYDQACASHDVEMDGMREALLAKFGVVPLLDTYRQMAVRHQKAKDWAEALRWAQRGLALYGDDAARPEAVEDLNKRAAAYSARLAGAMAGAPRQPIVADRVTAPKAITETLTCEGCGANWDRAVTRGRKPRLCPACRA